MRRYFFCFLLIAGCIWGQERLAWAQLTLLLPDAPRKDTLPASTKKPSARKHGPATPVMDLLLAQLHPAQPEGLSMDMPQRVAVARLFKETQEGGEARTPALQTHWEEYLGDLEEIRYLQKKAWVLHLPIAQAGLYQIVVETRPRWEAERDHFRQDFVKLEVPVQRVAAGWERPAGLSVEIVPLTRPFGLLSPALFTGQVVCGGAPAAHTPVSIIRFNNDRLRFPSSWHEEQEVVTDERGIFSFVCPLSGWWAFTALTEGDPLKGPDGQSKPLLRGATLWIYVDDARGLSGARKGGN